MPHSHTHSLSHGTRQGKPTRERRGAERLGSGANQRRLTLVEASGPLLAARLICVLVVRMNAIGTEPGGMRELRRF